MSQSVEDFERTTTIALQQVLQANLDTVAAAYLANDRADGLADPDGTSWVKLQAPAAITGGPSGFGDYYPGGIDLVTAWPSIEIAVPDELFTDFDIAQRDARAEINLIVQVWLKDGRFPVLNRMMKRYAAAVAAALLAPGTLGDASVTQLRRAYRTNPEVKDENDRIQSGVLLFLTLETALIRA